MTLNEFNDYLNAFLKKENFPADPSLNGIQIQNSEPDSKQIKKIAFAVDACEESAKIAALGIANPKVCLVAKDLNPLHDNDLIIPFKVARGKSIY